MKLKNNKLLSSILIISSGTAFAQVLNILFSPIITRIYTPEEFGIVSIFTVFIALLSVTTLKYEIAIPISNKEKQGLTLYLSSILISVIFNLIILCGIILLSDEINNLFRFEDHPSIIYLIPLGAFLISLFNISREWAIRKSSYKDISKASIVQSIGGNVSKVIFGLFGFSATGLAVARIVTGSLGFFSLSKGIIKDLKNLLKVISYQDVIYVLKRYKNFAIYMAPNSLIIILVTQFPIIIIGILYQPEIVGYYSLAHTIIMLPIAVLGDSIADVFYSESAKKIKNDSAHILVLCRKIVIKLFLISVIPAFILVVTGPLLFEFIFGKEWYYAGVFSQVLSLVLIAKLTFHPMNKIFELIEKQKHKFYLNILQLLLLLILFVLSNLLNIEPIYFILYYSIVVFLMNLIIFTWSYILLKNHIVKYSS